MADAGDVAVFSGAGEDGLVRLGDDDVEDDGVEVFVFRGGRGVPSGGRRGRVRAGRRGFCHRVRWRLFGSRGPLAAVPLAGAEDGDFLPVIGGELFTEKTGKPERLNLELVWKIVGCVLCNDSPRMEGGFEEVGVGHCDS